MRLRFTNGARTEISEAASYYNKEWSGLGDEFLNELQFAFDDLRENPERWPVVGENVRKRVLGSFLYSIYYSVHPDHMLIYAVSHFKRRPGYWRNRD